MLSRWTTFITWLHMASGKAPLKRENPSAARRSDPSGAANGSELRSRDSSSLSVGLLEVDGRPVSDAGVPTVGVVRVVPALDVAEELGPGLGMIPEAGLVEQLAFEAGEEALGPWRCRSSPRRSPSRARCRRRCSVSRRPGKCLDRSGGSRPRTALEDRHLQRLDHEAAGQGRIHGPADDASTEDVEDDPALRDLAAVLAPAPG